MNNYTETPSVIVDGDVTMDWNLAELGASDRGHSGWRTDVRSRMCWQCGGAALVSELLQHAVSDRPEISVLTTDLPTEPVRNDDERFHHAYAMWRRDPDSIWRVHQFLGVDPRRTKLKRAAISAGDALVRLLVIDDAALGYRETRDSWPEPLLDAQADPWILLKMAGPVATGALWNHAIRSRPHRLIALLTVEDLRRTEVQISRGLSWERTAQDVVWELEHNPCVNGLSRCAFTIITFGSAGAIVHSAETGAWTLVFDPQVMEGGWERPSRGRMIGNTVTMTAAVSRQLLLNPTAPRVTTGACSGISATRALYNAGYALETGSDELDIGFPFEKVARAIQGEPVSLAAVEIQNPVRFLRSERKPEDSPQRPAFWTILEDRYRSELGELAERIVLDGMEASLSDIPLGRVGVLTTVDRHEIESLRSIQGVLSEYCRDRQKKPLSIAVFGPPGAGKSFGVQQVAKSIDGDAIKDVTFNLSQFDRPQDLLGALHQVRDIGLSGKIPLVFWDEFDTSLDKQPLGWLRYFLAPMQDGTFQEGQISHPIGRCIFVFAGGTSSTMEQFVSSLKDESERKAAKLPDFASRLKGFLNVLGPNPQTRDDGHGDPYYILRRAILLRSLLERNAAHLFESTGIGKRLKIDTGVLRALLQVSRYKHGIRSLESVLMMSELSGKSAFQRSSLPSEPQLDLHVDGREFLSLVQSIVLNDELVERLAEAAHEVWREGKARDEWTFGEIKDEKRKTHPWLIAYGDLPEHAREANRRTVRSIPEKLAMAGYAMVPARSDEPALEFPGDDLETLAEFEHESWMEAKLSDGFTLGKPTNEEPFKNEYLLPWDDIPDGIKQADRDLVRGIPVILSKAGYAIVKLRNRSGA